ncbi:cortexin domain-containing 1-like [Puntigrus tetrazona]|uniref:cortexin domain-containing 1-like n=1 Tax=Puntigrus tetrazona TaxID=1606681 RepID=UPI001C89C3E3|nr:cortexin domain-containing 1-like [Puntigrus tetrazona]
MDQPAPPASSWLEIDVDLGFALFFLLLLCLFLLVTVVRCAQTVVDPYGAISTSTYQEEQINN